jgi:hypothetical protein
MFAVPRAIFYKIKVHGQVLGGATIVPWNAQDIIASGTCNATGLDPNVDNPDYGFWRPGKATVHFSPQTWSSGPCAGGGVGSRPEEILFHELVHAARFVGRDFSQIPLSGGMAGYDDEEEFFAVLITNIYLSEAGRANLRLDHHGFSNLPAPMTKSEAFLKVPENNRLIRKFCSQHPNIAPMIAKARAAFNPIRAYYDSQPWYLR